MLSEELMREVRRLRVRARRRAQGLFAGAYHSAFKGRGIEFADVREYEPGDDVRAIDWNVTARTGRPHIKRFVEERELTLTLAVDVSASGSFGSGPRSKGRVAAELAGVVAAAALMNNDRVALTLLSDRVEMHLGPGKGRAHLSRVIRELLARQGTGRGTDLAGGIAHLRRTNRRRGLIMLVSDFALEPTALESLRPALSALAAAHELVAVVVEDPAERALPSAGLVRLRDAEGPGVGLVDASSRRVREAWARGYAEWSGAVSGLLARAGVGEIRVATDRPFMPALERWFSTRARGRARA